MNDPEEHIYSVHLKQWQMKYLMNLIENETEGPMDGVSMQDLREMWWAFDDPLDIVYNDGKRPSFLRVGK